MRGILAGVQNRDPTITGETRRRSVTATGNERLEILHRIRNTLVHAWDTRGLIVSRKNSFYRIADLSRPRLELLGRIPWSPRQWPAHVRLADRVLKHSLLQVHGTRSGRWLVADGRRFWWIDPDGTAEPVARFSATRPMNRGICESPDGVIYVADYVANLDRIEPIRIYASTDMLRFAPVWEFAPGEVRHVHALIPDSGGRRIWVLTGDHDHESRILYTDDGFASLETFLAAGQRTRATDLVISGERLIWGMDSPLETSWIFDAAVDDPADCRRLYELPGPAYYMTRNGAGGIYLGTTAEPGPAVRDRYGRIFATDPQGGWHEIHRRRDDPFPQFGIFYFPRGELPENYLVFSQRALTPNEGCLTIARDRVWG